MPLTLYRSHRLEYLAILLAQQLRKHPAPPLQAECVVVQSLGLRRWLSYELAKQLGVAMHIEFPFPAQLVEETLADLAPGTPPSPALRREILPWRVHAVLPGLLSRREFAPLRRHAGEDALKLWQLSGQLAATLDRYLAYRPDLVLRWEAGDVRPEEQWQAQLWRAVAQKQPHAPGLLQQAANAKGSAELPLFKEAGRPRRERVSIFGVNTLPPFHLQVLQRLAAETDVSLYLLVPTREYWGDIRSEREQARLRRWMAQHELDPAAQEFVEGHPLLASLGKIGREFHEALLDLTPNDEIDFFDLPRKKPPQKPEPERTLLADLQHSMLMLEVPETPRPIGAGDSSIQLHSCHSPMRELEVLHDQLLARFAADPSLEPRHVLVAVTNMDLYAPCIEAVFGAPESEAVRFPFSIADRAARVENAVAAAFLRTLALLDGRFPANAVLGLLDCAAIRARFGLEEDDLPLLREWVARSGIRWGIDERHRERLGLPGVREHTWRFGLDRLLLGFALPTEGDALFHGILPDGDIEGAYATTLGQFATFCSVLFALGEKFAALSLPATGWAAELRLALAQLCSGDETFAADFRTTASRIEAMGMQAAQAGHEAPLPFTVARAYLHAAFADDDSGGGFLRGGITFCSLKPMRAVPHRIIAVLGLNDDAFPRTAGAPAFDLTAAHPRPGDRTLRDDDRYLFLETLLSARDTLLLSYQGQSTRDNSARPPSAIVAELLDYLTRYYTPAPPYRTMTEQIVTPHRLQAFSPGYFASGETRLFSYSQENARAAARASGPREPAALFPSALPALDIPRDVSLATLADALSHPTRFFARQRLGLTLPFEEAAPEDSEPMVFDGLEKYALSTQLVESRLAGANAGALLSPTRAAGELPHGYAGDSAFAAADLAAEQIAAEVAKHAPGKKLPPQELTLPIGDWNLHATLRGLTAEAMVQYRVAHTGARDLLRAWLAHLALCAAEAPGLPQQTIVVGTDEVSSLPKLCANEARQHLTRLLALYQRAHAEALPIFPKSSWAFARATLRPSPRQRREPIEIAECCWLGGPYETGEAAEAWHALIWTSHPKPLGPAFRQLACDLFGPLLNTLRPA